MIKGSKGIIDACLHAIRCIPYWPALHRESSNLLRGRQVKLLTIFVYRIKSLADLIRMKLWIFRRICLSLQAILNRHIRLQFAYANCSISGFRGGVRLRECVACSNLINHKWGAKYLLTLISYILSQSMWFFHEILPG